MADAVEVGATGVDISLLDVNLNFDFGSAETGEVLHAIGAIGQVLNSQIDDIYQSITRRIGQEATNQGELEATIADIVTRIRLEQDITLGQNIWDAANAITGWIEGRDIASSRDVTASSENVVNAITGALLSVVNGSGGLRRLVTDQHEKTRREQAANILALERGLTDDIGRSNSILSDILGAVTAPIEREINNIINIPGNILDGVVGEIRGIIGDIERATSGEIDDIVNGILGPMKEASSTVAQAIPDTQDELIGIKDELGSMAAWFGSGTDKSGSVEDWQKVLEGAIYSPGTVGIPDEPSGPTPDDPVKDPAGPFQNARTWTECLNRLGNPGPAGRATGLVQELISGITSVLFGRVGVMNDINNQFMLYTIRQCVSDQILPPPELIKGRYLGHVSETDYNVEMKKHGVSRDDAAVLFENGRQFSSPYEYLHWWHRGLLPESALDKILAKMRYTEWDIRDMKTASYFIPPAQDLIVMAVREVFSPEARAANRQDEDFPPDFERYAGQQGISSEWAKNYWAAHWTLPSPQQGFEMFQRDVITRDQLDALLVALDVMPAWRDRMTAIAYNPIGRIDIRRIHALGQITDDELVTRYRYAGYSPADAQAMADFTIQYNAEPDPEPDNIAAGMTRSTIIGFYKDGIIERGRAKDSLLAIGIGEAAAEAFLDQADIDEDYRQNAQDIQLIVSAFRAQRRSYEESRNLLVALNLPLKILARAVFQLDVIRNRQTRKPTKADLVKFQKAGFITDQEYKARLELLGYTGADAELYRRLLVEAPEQEQAPTVEVNIETQENAPGGSFSATPGSPIYGTS